MRAGVLLDRDGTVIEERGYLDRFELIAPFPWSAAAIRLLNDAGFPVAIVTNQAGIARGYFDEAFVREAHRRLDAMLREAGAVVDAYYYCPHHPDGIVEGYRRACDCRKPGGGMAETAARDLQLDLARSYVVGDKRLDVELAHNVGATGVLVRTGYGRQDEPGLRERPVPGVVVVETLLDAARWIVAQAPAVRAERD